MTRRKDTEARSFLDGEADQKPAPIAPSALRSRLLSGGAWALVGRAAALLFAFAANALLARLLSPQDLGTYFLAYSVVGLGWVAGSLGLNNAVVRFAAESLGLDQPGRTRRVISTVLGLGTVGSLGVGLAYLLLGDFLAERFFSAPALAAVTGLVAGWMVVMSMQGLLAETFRGFHDIRSATIFGNFNGLLVGGLFVASLTLLWLLGGGASLPIVIVLAASSSCASLLLATWSLRRKVKPLPAHDADPTVGVLEVLRVAWPLLIVNLLIFALAQADLWIVGALRPQEEVAVYGAASRTVLLVAMPVVVAEAVVSPLIAEMYAQGRKRELERTLRAIAALAGILALLSLAGLALLGGPVLVLIFGDYYAGGASVLTLLCMGQLASACVGSCASLLAMTGHQVAMMVVFVCSGALTVLALLWAVGLYGALGAAAVMAVSAVVRSVAILLVARYQTGIWTHFGIADLASYVRMSWTPRS